MPEAVPAIDAERARRFAHDLRLGGRLDAARFDALQVAGEVKDAVRVVTGQVGIHQDLGDLPGDGARRSRGGQEPPGDAVKMTRGKAFRLLHPTASCRVAAPAGARFEGMFAWGRGVSSEESSCDQA